MLRHIRSTALWILILSLVGLSGAEACCGPNRSAEFFARQPHAFKHPTRNLYMRNHPRLSARVNRRHRR